MEIRKNYQTSANPNQSQNYRLVGFRSHPQNSWLKNAPRVKNLPGNRFVRRMVV